MKTLNENHVHPNMIEPKPKHGAKGTHRQFKGRWIADCTQYTGDREGCDIYCANCNHWNTVKGTSILFSLLGRCKNCDTLFDPKDGERLSGLKFDEAKKK